MRKRTLLLACLICVAIILPIKIFDFNILPDDSQFPLSVAICANPIDVVALTSTLSFNNLWPGADDFSNQTGGHPRCTIENLGYATVDLTVSAICTTGWSLGTSLGDMGPNRMVLAGIFTAPAIESESPFPNGRDLLPINFGNNDVITESPSTATQTVFAIDSGSGGAQGDDSDEVKGFSVPLIPGGSVQRHLRFMLQAPVSDSTTNDYQELIIVIGAVVH